MKVNKSIKCEHCGEIGIRSAFKTVTKKILVEDPIVQRNNLYVSTETNYLCPECGHVGIIKEKFYIHDNALIKITENADGSEVQNSNDKN